MGELYLVKATNEEVVFTLTSDAFRKMCAFPVENSVNYAVEQNGMQIVTVDWPPDDPKDVSEENWMTLATYDRCKTYFLSESLTDELIYNLPSVGSEVVHYIIN